MSSADYWFGHSRLGTLLGTYGAFFARPVQNTEGNREKATVSLTVASFLREPLGGGALLFQELVRGKLHY